MIQLHKQSQSIFALWVVSDSLGKSASFITGPEIAVILIHVPSCDLPTPCHMAIILLPPLSCDLLTPM